MVVNRRSVLWLEQ
jgi:RNase P subunit RPR2